jgi:hypothetical protein
VLVGHIQRAWNKERRRKGEYVQPSFQAIPLHSMKTCLGMHAQHRTWQVADVVLLLWPHIQQQAAWLVGQTAQGQAHKQRQSAHAESTS